MKLDEVVPTINQSNLKQKNRMALLAFKPVEEPILQIIDRTRDNKADVICLIGDDSGKKRIDKLISK